MKINAVSNVYNADNILEKSALRTNFKGNDSFERTSSNLIGSLNHETHFFREPETDEFVQNYILNNFKDKDNIHIVSGACSTGEEARSYAVMLDGIKDKVSITGFDVDEKSIQQAKQGVYKVKNVLQVMSEYDTVKNQEGFLLSDSPDMPEYQKRAKEKFYEYFKPAGSKEIEKQKLSLRIADAVTNFILRKSFKEAGIKIQPRKVETQDFIAKEGAFDNVDFMQGDILNTSQMFKKDSVDVFLFRNALYHLVCIGNSSIRVMKPDAEETIKNIAEQIYDVLAPGGLLVFGEDEGIIQGIDDEIVSNVMKQQGFEPVIPNEADLSKRQGFKTKVNIWKKPEA